MTFICTASGNRFYFDPEEMFDQNPISLYDIAHSLSYICRFTGHTRFFYSVAHHSILAAQRVPEEARLHVLMHDAAEAYLGDVSRTLKKLIGPFYKEISARVDERIFNRCGVTQLFPGIMKEADDRMLVTEANQLMNQHDLTDWPHLRGIEPYPIVIEQVDPKVVREMFINLYYVYGGKP